MSRTVLLVSLTLPMMMPLAALGQPEKKPPTPDRFVKVESSTELLPATVLENFRHAKKTTLLINRIAFGIQYARPDEQAAHGDPEKDFSRLPNCYFHPDGPAGIVMKK